MGRVEEVLLEKDKRKHINIDEIKTVRGEESRKGHKKFNSNFTPDTAR